jgi:hypothetical protein
MLGDLAVLGSALSNFFPASQLAPPWRDGRHTRNQLPLQLEALLNVGLPPWQADGLIEDYAHYRRGEAAAVEEGIQDATGMPPRTFDDFARDYASVFAQH